MNPRPSRLHICIIFILFHLLHPHAAAAQQAADYYRQAIESKQRAEFQQAYRLAELADSLLRQAPVDEQSLPLAAQIFYLQGTMLYNLGDYPRAMLLLQQADSCYLLQDDAGGRADCHLFMGNSVWYTEGTAAAAAYFDTAIQWAEQDSTGRRQYRGKYYLDKAYALSELGSYEQAYTLIAYGLNLDSVSYGYYSRAYAQGLMVRAIVDNYAGDYYRAVHSYKAAIHIHQQVGGEDMQAQLAPIYGNLAFAYFNIHDLVESDRYALKALATYELVSQGVHPYYFALLYVHLATLCNNRNQFEQALTWYEKAAPLITQENTDLQFSLPFGRMVSLSGIGQYAQADSLARAIEPQVITYYGPGHINVATYYENFADNLIKLDSLQACLLALQKAEAVYDTIYTAKHPIKTYLISHRAQALLASGLYRQSLEESNRGLAFFESNQPDLQLQYRNPYYQLQLCRAQAHLALAVGADSILHLRKALECYQALESLSDRLMQEERNQDDRRYQRMESGQLYSETMEIYGRLTKAGEDHFHAMWRLSEKNKSLMLLNELVRSRLPVLEELLDTLRQLSIAYNYYQQKISNAKLADSPNTESLVLQWQALAFDFEEQRRDVWERLRKQQPSLAGYFDPGTAIIDPVYARDSLLAQGQGILSYFIGNNNLFLFVITRDTNLLHIQPLDTASLRQQIQSLHFGLFSHQQQGYKELNQEIVQTYVTAAVELFRLLIAPVAARLPDRLVIIPDGILGYVPFDALLSTQPTELSNFKNYPYLLYDYQFSYTYSASLLQEMYHRDRRSPAPKEFIAFAPFFSASLPQLAEAYKDSEFSPSQFPLLVHSGLEIASAAVYMKGDVVTGQVATEELFREVVRDYRIVHLLTHGFADNRLGDHAFLAFAPLNDSLENERLYLREIYQLQLSAEVIVLSACETAIGPLQRGEGVISLARAFAFAGAGSLLTSLWKIDNRATSYLMRNLYSELAQGSEKDAALRLARLRFLQESTVFLSYPYYWAAFLPVGDMRPLR